MAKEVYVDADECTACGQCADNLSDVFQMNDDGIAEVVAGWEADEDDVQEEIDSCPGECIHWKE